MPSDCSICSNSLEAKTLPCGHSFHCPCIDQWQANSNSCPICRRTYDNTEALLSGPSESVECYVCLEYIHVVKGLICGHEFHDSCVNPMLVEANKCPECSMFCGIDEELDLSVCKFCDEQVMDGELTLPCGHTLHRSCSVSWIQEKKTCPECLTPLEDPSKVSSCVSETTEVVFICGHKFHHTCSVSWNNCPTCGESALERPAQFCTLCDQSISRDETVLPCGHKFHKNCVLSWQTEQKMCPTCLEPLENQQPTTVSSLCSTSSETNPETEVVFICGHTFHRNCSVTWNNCPTCGQSALERPDELCTFCDQSISSDETVLPCGHKFHKNCVLSWQTEQKMCPTCLEPLENPLPTTDCCTSSQTTSENEVVFICGHKFHRTCSASWNNCPTCGECALERPDEFCTFCDQSISIDETVLPCGHMFHTNCLTSWLREYNTCPICLEPLENPLLTTVSSLCSTSSIEIASPQIDVCTFCTRRVSRDETVLPCGHKFHEDCVSPWQREQKMCPDCLMPCEQPAFLNEACSLDTSTGLMCLLCSEDIPRDEFELSCGHKFHRLCFDSWQGEVKKCPECLLPCDDAVFPMVPPGELPFPPEIQETSNIPPNQEPTLSERNCPLDLEEITAQPSTETPDEQTSNKNENSPTTEICPADDQSSSGSVEPTQTDTCTSSHTCVACSLSITHGELTLPCGHKYHKACVTALLENVDILDSSERKITTSEVSHNVECTSEL